MTNMNEEIVNILRDEHNRRFKEIERLLKKGNSFSSLGITILIVLMTVGFQDNYSYVFLIIPILAYWLSLEIITTARVITTTSKYVIIIENMINKHYKKKILLWENYIAKKHLINKPIQHFWNGISYLFLMGLMIVSSIMVFKEFNSLIFIIHLFLTISMIVSSHILFNKYKKDMKVLPQDIRKEFLKPL